MSDNHLMRVKVTIELTDCEGLVHSSSRQDEEFEELPNDFSFLGSTIAWTINGLDDRVHDEAMVEALNGFLVGVYINREDDGDAEEFRDAIDVMREAIASYQEKKRQLREGGR